MLDIDILKTFLKIYNFFSFLIKVISLIYLMSHVLVVTNPLSSLRIGTS